SGISAKTLPELVELIKGSSTKFSYGTYGVGSTAHLYGHLFAKQAGLDLVHIAYRGEAPSVADLLGGQIPLAFVSGNGAKAHLATGRMRALAVTGPERSLIAPDVPTFTELGYKQMDVNGWYGFFAPKGTPPEIVSKISKDINEILADPAIQKNFRDIDIQLVGSTPEEFANEMKPRYEMWGRLIKEAGIKVE
nr:tripartite tricarboxylate transporter substrate binding protein [Pseudomonas sp.]